MDKLSGMLGGGGDKHSNQSTSTSTSNQPKEDYLDKGLDAVEKKFGGGNIDTDKMRSTNEKITDSAREAFEKATGKDVPDKVSN